MPTWLAVLDLGLANRTFIAHDVAIALERSTVAWLDLDAAGRADADLVSIDAFLDGYETVRRLSRAELTAVAAVLPVVHLEYALSEVEYFADILASRERADLAYGSYLVGHTRWFEGSEGQEVLDLLAARAAAVSRELPDGS